jgi:hypothetical protein
VTTYKAELAVIDAGIDRHPLRAPRPKISGLRGVAAVVLVAVSIVLTGQVPAYARASVRVNNAGFEIRYGISTSTRFTVVGDGGVTVTSRATAGGAYSIQVQRENCGSFGCHGYRLVGNRETLPADGRWRTVTLRPGNSARQHKIWISKPNDGRSIRGVLSFR